MWVCSLTRAAECRKLAALATSQEARTEYETLATLYDGIAEAELKLANARDKSLAPENPPSACVGYGTNREVVSYRCEGKSQ